MVVALRTFFESLQDRVTNRLKTIFDVLNEATGDVLEPVTDRIVDILTGIFDGVFTLAGGAFDGFDAFVDGPKFSRNR